MQIDYPSVNGLRSTSDDIIVAKASGQGGAIAVIRVSGAGAISLVDSLFSKSIADAPGYSVHLGFIRSGAEGAGKQSAVRAAGIGDGLTSFKETRNNSQFSTIDQVLVTLFRAPHSYTGEDAVEISCHASPYIEREIIQLLISKGARLAVPGRNADGDSAIVPPQQYSSGVRLATPGEFTMRAFLAGKMDLAQAEAVADLIASSDRSGHALAMAQMRGGVSDAISLLRTELLELAALLELELDFGEEDVEFASRERLRDLAGRIEAEIARLRESFALGNAIREGVPVAIVGRPNAGKSTLLNALVGDDRAMVSAIAGTTRDRVEERVNLGGITFRFIDTAGLRATDDELERMGIERSRAAIAEARIVLLVVDATSSDPVEQLTLRPDQRLCVVVNKVDVVSGSPASGSVRISAKTGAGLDALREWLVGAVDEGELGSGAISSARHFEALTLAAEAVGRVLAGLSGYGSASGRMGDFGDDCGFGGGVSADMLAQDVRTTLYHLGTITGTVTTDEILATIFSRFCIGK